MTKETQPIIEIMDTALHSGTFDWGCPWDRKLDLRCKALRIQAIELARRFYRHLEQEQRGSYGGPGQ
ncbi:MAG TPA: hypothetical protein VFA32_07655 [Dehalococcoidia bacterium]|jgi:hypothetical protein|nr:hypothetical protein [Dehalococcoidia bacterium]